MIIKDFKIDESHPKEVLISAEVLIKREGKWYKVEYRRTIEDFNHRNFITTEAGRLRDRLEAVKNALEEMERIDKYHIPFKEGQSDTRLRNLVNEEFIW